MTYELLDSGNQEKLEQFGNYVIARPCSQALWKPQLPREVWERADARFTRENGNRWIYRKPLPESWIVEVEGIKFKLAPTDFGHLGVFPEHSMLWSRIQEKANESHNLLNLFAYSGGATLAMAQTGAKVCHLDASKGMVAWARENAALNKLEKAPIRWIVDDVTKFLQREVKRGVRYDGILLDPPSFGRGRQGEMFIIERDLHPILDLCKQLLSDNPLFFILTSHTPGVTSAVMANLMMQLKPKGNIESGELYIEGPLVIPCGSFVRWTP